MANNVAVQEYNSPEDQCLHLLKCLMQTVEWLLSSCATNVWNTYGSLSRLGSIIDEILTHGLRNEGIQKYWHFICGLRWLQPELAPPILGSEINGRPDPSQECLQAHVFLQKSLLEHTLSAQLQTLITNQNHLCYYYQETAFLCNSSCTSALLTCLKAIESNQPSLLASLDPALIVKTVYQTNHRKVTTVKDISLGNVSPNACNETQEKRNELQSSLNVQHSNTGKSLPNVEHTYEYKRIFNTTGELFNESKHAFEGISYSNQGKLSTRYTRRNQRLKGKQSFRYNVEKLSSKNINTAGLSNKYIHDKSTSKTTVDQTQKIYENIPKFLVNQNCNIMENKIEVQNLQASVQNNIIQCNVRFKTQRSYSYPGMSRNLPKKRHKSFSNDTISEVCNKVLCDNQAGLFSELKDANLQDLHEKTCTNTSSNGSECVTSTNCETTELCTNNSSVCDKKTIEFKSPDAQLEKSNCADNPSASPIAWKVQHARSKSDTSCSSHSKNFPDDEDDGSETSFSSSLPAVLPPEKKERKKSIFEGGQIVVPTECFFPRPQLGQSLTSFLSSTDFNICAELDRENAHFCISEALISAIEHIKCSQTLKIVEEDAESDEEIRKLTQRIRIRRGEKQREKAVKNITLLSDGKTDTTTSQSASSPLPSSQSSDFDAAESIGSDDEIDDLQMSDPVDSNLSSIKENGLSLSMASLYSDADIHKVPSYIPYIADSEDKSFRYGADSDGMHLSAEAVALSLLRRFSEKQLPKASDLEWLVSEQDAPQQLLPLPDSWPVSPDTIEEEYNLDKTRLRGNFEWAPPRRQIICIIHANSKRKDTILKQKYRCAGCGMRIERNYMNKFRYCDYLGKYFCHCCHGNDLAFIPGRILCKWDFTKYYVSKFAWKLLDQMFGDPLFNVMDINCKLYQKVRQLELCRGYRMQLYYLKDFIKTCRKAEQIQVEIVQYSQYILEPHMYAISDLLQVKSGDLSKCLQPLVIKCINHVMQCVLCQAKGFICEICNKDTDIIFPFQLSKVCHCDVCGSCFHKRCYKSQICPKCVRIEERKKRNEEQKMILSSDDEL